MRPALATVLAALEAERLTPVPRASRAACVDVDDLALVLHHAPHSGMSADTAGAYRRLAAIVRAHVAAGACAPTATGREAGQ
ncbi:MAG TPA: hypothetical protein VH478_04550 [Trebonia sp.]|nr:hypothetical protein [Trebonia sp.]